MRHLRFFAALSGLCAAAALSLCACAQPAEAPSSAAASAAGDSAAYTFTDHLGRTVTVAQPRRTAALIGSFADIWCLAGGIDSLVACANDTWTYFDWELSESVVDLGGVKSPDLEALLAAEPDFVLASSNTAADLELLDTLEAAGIPTAYFNVSSFEDYLEVLQVCTDITGRSDLFRENGTDVKAQVEAVQARRSELAGQSVLYLRATGSSCKVKNSQNNVLGEMLADLGCVNIADSRSSLLENLSLEAIMAADPDHIFIVMQGSDPSKAQSTLETTVLSHPAWQQLTAVKEGRVHYMDQTLYNLKPNARWGLAYEGLAAILES